MLKLNKKTLCIVFSLLLSLAVSAFVGIYKSEAANQVNVTAYVVDKSGQPLADGEYSIRFAIYSRDRLEMDPYPSNMDASFRIWQETQKISVFGGIMSAYLGAVTPLPGGIDFNQNDYYLGTQIGTDSEMAPRKKLGSALSAINSSFLQGRTVGNQAGNIPALGTNGGLDPVILDKINRVGTISQGTWEGDVIANDYLETDFTGKTYEGLTIATSGGNSTLTVSSDVTLNQNLSTISTPTFAAINLTDGLPIASGGTNATSIGAAGSVAYSDGTAYAFTGAGTAGQYLVSNGSGAPTWQAIAGGGVGGAGLAGHMPYWSDANNLAYDTDGNFYWDTANNRLGIGTATPAQALDVAGAIRSSSQFISTIASGTAPIQVSSNTLVANLNADYLDGQHASAFLTGNQIITLSGDVTGSGTTSIATTIANNSVDGTDIALGSDAQGDIMYYNGTDWTRLAAGASGQFLATNGAGSNPSWGVPSGAGDITAIGNVSSGEAFTGTQGTELYFNDSDGDGLLTIANLSAARTYTLPDATGTIITSGNLTGITATGTIASGTWNGGVIDEAYGGTGMAAYAEGDMLYYDGGTLTRLAAGTNGQILGAVGGAGNVNPTWMNAPFVGSHNLLSLSHPDTTAASPLAGDLITGIDTGGGTIRWQRYAIGSANDILMANGTGNGVDWNPQTSITQLGTITVGTWNGTDIDVAHGGTGLGTINQGGILYADADDNLAALEGASGDDTEYLRFHWNGGSPYVAWETASGSFTSFTLSGDSGSNQTISDTNTLEIAGGTNINSVASATDTITLNLDSTLSGVTWNGNTIGVGYGGTGITGTPTNGQLLIGNGTNYTLANLASSSASIAITNTAGGINLESSLGTSVSLTSEVTGTLPVANGGTGAVTLTDGGILLGNGTNAVTPMGVLGDGNIIIGDGVTDPTTLAAFSSSTGTLYHEYGGLEANVSAYAGLLKISGGTTSYIPDNSTNWDTAYSHSLGNTQAHSDYLINNGDDTTSGRLTAAGFTTNIQNGLQFDPFDTGAGDTSEIRFMELAANGSNYVGFKAPDNIADGSGSVIWTLPAVAGSANNVLTTDSSGNLSWTSVAGVGGMNSFTLSGDSGADQTIDDADILEIVGGTNITSVASATDTITLNLDSTLTGTTWNGNTIGVGYGGTGITGTPTNGQLLIGNGTNYTLAILTDGAGINITEGSGTITIAAALGNSVDLTSEVTGILPVANGGTNTNASPTAGAISYGNGSAYAFSTAGTAGQVLLSGGAGAPTWTTGTLTLAGNFVTSGASSLTLATTGATNVTLPTGGTLATLTGVENLTNKTLGAGSTWNGNTIGSTYITDDDILEVDLKVSNPPSAGQILKYDSGTGGFSWANETGGSGSSKWTDATTYTYLTQTSENLVLGSTGTSDAKFLFDVSDSSITFEGATNDAFVTRFVITDPTANQTITFPNASGTVVFSGGSGSSLWTNDGTITYLTETGDDMVVGGSDLSSPLSVDVSANTVRIGDATAAGSAILNMYASDGDTGSITYNTNDAWAFEGGNVGIGDTSPLSLLTIGSGDLFQVNSSGQIAAAAGITSSGTITFSGISTDGVVTVASGVLGSEARLAIARGGTNTNATPTAGAISYGTGSAYAFNTAGTAGQVLLSGGAGAPTWTTGTLSLAGNFITSGANSLTLITAGETNVTLPTGGTLATLALAETFTNKTIGSGSTWNGNTIAVGYGGTGITGTPTNGQLLIGNGTNYTLANLTSSGASIAITNTAGGINLESSLGTSVSLTSEVTGTLPVGSGGTGAVALTDGGILLGSGTSAITPMGVLGDGNIVIGDGVTDPTTLAAFSSSTGTLYHEYGGLEANVSAYSGLLKISGGTTSYVTDNSTNWDTAYSHSLDNTQAHSDYLINNGDDTTSGRLTAAGFTTNIQNGLQFDPFNTGAGNTSEIRFMELAANGSNYVGFKAPDNIADGSGSVIWTLPAVAGSANNVLTTDISGNLSWTSVAGVGGMNSFTLSGDSGADQTIDDADILEIVGGTNINSVASATDTITLNLDSTLSGTTWNGNTIGVGYGGTGITGTPTNGQLLIGNGTNYTLANLASSGASIAITNTAGGINLESSLGTSVSLTSEVTGTLPVANGGTGITTAGLTGVPVISSGTWSVDANALAVTHGGTGEISEANLENKVEAYIFDADAQNILGAWTVNDNVALRFGTNDDLQISYDETTDDRLEITDGSNLLGAFSDAGTVGNLYLTGGISTFDNTVTAGYGEFTGLCLGNNGANCITNWGAAGALSGSGGVGTVAYWVSSNELGGMTQLSTAMGGTGLDTATATGVPIITAGTWSVSSILGAALGGTGVNGSSAGSGTLLIGNGSGYSLATLTDGTGITITEGAGSITIDSTLGTSVDGTEIAITSQAQGDVLYYNGSAWVRLAAGSAGQYLQGGTAPSWDTPTGAGDVTDVGDCSGGACFNGALNNGTYLSFYDPQGTGQLITGNLTEARVWTLPDATGTVALTSDLHSASTITDTTSIDMSIAGQQISGVVLPAGVDHNSLANLTVGDYHTQYALLAGRSGGQTLIGGTASGDDLTLQTTSDVSKGSYILSDLASGLVLSTSGTLSVITDSSANWDAGYTNRLTGVTDNVTGLDFSLASNNATLALTSGYVIPTTTQETNWGSAYSHSTATTNVHGLTFTAEGSGGGLDADTIDNHDTSYFQTALTNPVTGTGTAGHLAYWSSASAITYDANGNFYWDATNNRLGIGTTAPANLLSLQQTGTVKANTDMLSLTNFGTAADMDGTATSILFNQYYYDGGGAPDLVDSGNITVGTETDWTSTSADQDSYMAFSTVLDGTMAEKMRITSEGNVGIGTTSSPIYKLEVAGNAKFLGNNQAITIGTSTGSTRGYITADATAIGLVAASGYDAYILNNSSVGLIVKDSTGNVGIGATSPSQALELGASKWLAFEGATDDTNETVLQVTDPTADNVITFPNVTGTVWTSGNDGSGSTLDADTLDGHDTAYFQVAGSYQPLHANLTSLSALSYSANSFVKMTAAGTFALDTNTYLTSYTETDPIWTAAASSYFNLSENETVTGIPAFNGGTTGASAPFTVDSTYLVTNLNADLLDGQTGSYYQTAYTNLNSIGSLANGTGYLSNNGSGTFSYSTSGLISGLTANYIPYATSATALGDSGMYWDSVNARLGIGTITPGAALQIGTLTPSNITTPINSLMVSGDLEVGGSIFMGPMSFPADSGAIAWIDMPVSTSVTADTVESYTASLGGTSILTIYGEALGTAGGVDATRVGIGTTTPGNLLSIQQAGSATANTNMFSLTNSGNAASMTNTRTSILFNQYYYDAATPALVDSGNISVGTEGNWTATTSTQDAYMAFSTVLNGTMAEKMRIDSVGNVGIGTTTPSQALELGASKWLAFEGATDDTNETTLQVTDPTADNTITFPNETGTVCTTGSVCAGYQAALSGGTNDYNTYWTGAGTLGAEQYVALTRGGTGATLAASNGGIVYSNASTLAILAGTATANQMLMSGSSTTPAWSTATYPATTTANQILYSSAANTIGGITTGNSGILVTSAGGVPSIATDIPTAVTLGSKYIYRADGTDVPVADGGTGVSSLTAYGLILGGTTSTGAVQSLGTGTSGQVLTSQGAGALPAWSTISGSLFTHNTNFTYLTTTTDDFVLGSSSTTNSPLFFDVSASELDIYGTTNKIKLSYDGTNYSSLATASNGDLTIASSNTAEAALVVGNNGALDASIQFDEVTQDYYFGVDNTDHFLKMGLGTAVGTTPYFTMSTAGKIGLGGMVAPTAMLHMTGVAGTVSLEINSNETTAASNVLMVRSDVAGADDAIFRVTAEGNVYADGAFTPSGADYAEYFKTKDADLAAGEAVCIDPENENAVVRCGRTGDSNIMGIVSSTPSVIGNAQDGRENDPNYKVIGMIGQIMGNVSTTENGEITVGDNLTAASTAGYMRKANAGESTVGIAMENFDGTKGQIHILISRRNQSLTVEKVEEAVEKNIAEMELQDQVDNLVSQASSNLNAQIENLSTTFSPAQKNIITAEIAAATDPIVAMQNRLQSQMDLIQEENKVIADFIANMDVASMLYDESLNLGSGLLEADGIVAGALTVKNENEENKTIGSNYIEPKDKDNDGKSYVIKTRAVTETATVFTSFQANPNAYSWVEKVKDPETKEYIGFKINLNSEVSSRVYFDWWIVEKDDRTKDSEIEASIEASTEASIEASTETVPAQTTTTTETEPGM